MNFHTFTTYRFLLLVGCALVISGCTGNEPVKRSRSNSSSYYGRSSSSTVNKGSLYQLYRSVNVKQEILSRSARGRRNETMRPLYVTIHSTQNWSKGADALRHSLALRRGALGAIGWHYTTDEYRAVQHLPTTEQGNHAENYRGTGNKYSIGIEMCENPGNSRSATTDKTARLAAYLCHKHKIPVSRVVPHYKWPRRGYSKANKNCPHFLMDNGRPGRKWQNFLNQVNRYYKQAL